MTTISRRVMLGGFAATAGGMAATAIPLPAPAAIDDIPETRDEKIARLTDELSAALREKWSSCVIVPGSDRTQCMIFISENREARL